jgi:hypothetical protein
MSRPTFDSNEIGRYDQVLNRALNLTTALQGAIEGRSGSSPQQHRASLVDLHNRRIGIAAVLNRALKAWHSLDYRQ